MREAPPAGHPLGDAYRLAIGAALDERLRYNSDVEAFVIPKVAAADDAIAFRLPDVDLNAELGTETHVLRRSLDAENGIISHWLERGSEELASFDRTHGHRQMFLRRRVVNDELSGQPRGTWHVIKQTFDDGRVVWAAAISTGYGRAYGRDDGWDKEPTYEEMRRRLQATEIYMIRGEVEESRQRAANMAALDEFGFCVGAKYRGPFRRGANTFSTAEIIEVSASPDPRVTIVGVDARGAGTLKIRWSKRGTRTFWTGEIGAAELGRLLRELEGEQRAGGVAA